MTSSVVHRRSSELVQNQPGDTAGTNSETNPSANNIAVVKRIRAPQRCRAVECLNGRGTRSKASTPKTQRGVRAHAMINMVAQTKNPSNPIAKIANTMAR